MPKVELVYAADCPNVEGARSHLLQALLRAGLAPDWREWDRASPESPEYVRSYGSPTVLVNGEDVARDSLRADGSLCRIYTDEQGKLSGLPSVEAIFKALSERKKGLPPASSTRSAG